MEKPPEPSGSDRLILLIKSAYWIALLLIAAMAMSSYMLLQQMIADHRRDANVVQLIASQKALSQRVIFLATAASTSAPEERIALISALRISTHDFEAGYDRLVQFTLQRGSKRDDERQSIIDSIFYGPPHNLDYFSLGLLSNAKRLAAAYDTRGAEVDAPHYRGGMEKALIDDTLAKATLNGYTALSDAISSVNDEGLSRLLTVNRNLFFVTIGLLLLIGAFIFRPMAEMMRRKTHDLVEAHKSMTFIATHDNLTGLYNRTVLKDRIDPLLTAASQTRRLGSGPINSV